MMNPATCFLALVCACVSFPAVVAEHCATPSPSVGATHSPSPTPFPSPAPWYRDRYHFYSEKAPIITTLRRVPGFSDRVDRTLDKLHETEDAILNSQTDRIQASTKSPSRRKLARNARHSLLPTCNLEDHAWRSAAESQFQGVLNTSTQFLCVTDVHPEGDEEIEWHDLISDFRRTVNDSAIEINKEAEARFDRPDTVYNFPYDTGTERCTVNAVGAFRVNDTWFVNVAITNELKSLHLRDLDRMFLAELMGRNGSHADMTLGVIPPDHNPEDYYKRSDASTLIVRHNGPASPDFFKPTLFEDNVAISRALDKFQLYMQQAHDARSPSSIAILFLPLFLNILPIALFADVSRIIMLLYALLSDVLTIMPLAIKGVELILIGSAKNVGVVVRMTSSHDGSRWPVAAAEVYTASCQSKVEVVNSGIAFLVIAIVFLVLGLVLEVVARQRSQMWRRKLT